MKINSYLIRKKMNSIKYVKAAVLAFAFLASAAHAGPNLVVNGNFEADTMPNGKWTIFNSLTGWDAGSNGVELRNNIAGRGETGANYVELDTYQNSSISQLIPTSIGEGYRLSFAYAPREGVAADSNGIQALWNNKVVRTMAKDGTSNVGNFWKIYYVNVIGGAGAASLLSFNAIGKSDGYGGSLDTVKVFSAVPEPTTFGMMIAGLGMLAFATRRKKIKNTLHG
jgi:hypothetical protein